MDDKPVAAFMNIPEEMLYDLDMHQHAVIHLLKQAMKRAKTFRPEYDENGVAFVRIEFKTRKED